MPTGATTPLTTTLQVQSQPAAQTSALHQPGSIVGILIGILVVIATIVLIFVCVGVAVYGYRHPASRVGMYMIEVSASLATLLYFFSVYTCWGDAFQVDYITSIFCQAHGQNVCDLLQFVYALHSYLSLHLDRLVKDVSGPTESIITMWRMNSWPVKNKLHY